MRNTVLAMTCLLTCALLVAGCYESLTNIATPDKVVFDDALLGDYKAVAPATGRLTLEGARTRRTPTGTTMTRTR